MSHFAEIDENNIVLRVLVGDNNSPNEGYDWFVSVLGGRWVQTSYNNNIRKNFANEGYLFDEVRDAFIKPTAFDSWVLNEETCVWEAPVPCPQDGAYSWNEDAGEWQAA